MCGLVGVYGDLFHPHVSFFKQALIADYFRGRHSTGLASIPPSGVPFIKKLAIDPINFLDIKSVDDNISQNKILLMGHNRHATMGGVNAANAHPFVHGDITLMHNGTLSNKYALEKKYDAPTFGTDSELVCYLLDKYNVEDVIKDLEGAFALTWWDSHNMTFNFIRNDERPLTLAITDDHVLYASEAKMLEWLIDRSNKTVSGSKSASGLDAKYNMYQPLAGCLHTFAMEKRKVTCVTEELELAPKPVIRTHYTSTGMGSGFSGGAYVRGVWVPNNRDGWTTTSGEVARIEDQTVKNLDRFNASKGTNFRKGDKVFCYIDKIVCKNDKVPNRVDFEMSLVCDPYFDVKAYYCDLSSISDISDVWCIEAEIMTATFTGERPALVLMNKPESWKLMRSEDDANTCPIFKRYCDFQIAQGEHDAVLPDFYGEFEGLDGRDLTYKEFKANTKNGCCVCADPIDLVAESTLQTVTFVSSSEYVCDGCVDIWDTEYKSEYSELNLQ